MSMWTGPVIIGAVASRLKDAGFQNVTEGTERVYWEVAEPSSLMHLTIADRNAVVWSKAERDVKAIFPTAGFVVDPPRWASAS